MSSEISTIGYNVKLNFWWKYQSKLYLFLKGKNAWMLLYLLLAARSRTEFAKVEQWRAEVAEQTLGFQEWHFQWQNQKLKGQPRYHHLLSFPQSLHLQPQWPPTVLGARAFPLHWGPSPAAVRCFALDTWPLWTSQMCCILTGSSRGTPRASRALSLMSSVRSWSRRRMVVSTPRVLLLQCRASSFLVMWQSTSQSRQSGKSGGAWNARCSA